MDKLKQIAELVKRRKAVVDDCVRELRKADAASDGGVRERALTDAARLLARVQAITAQIDELYGAQITELEQLRNAAAQQGAEAIAAAQGAITRMASGAAPENDGSAL
jgi:hypothetical protein